MFNIDTHTRVYISLTPVDFRKQIDGLALAVQETLALDPFSSHLFVFTNRQRDKLKLLYWHHNGFVLLYKRLERGRFRWPVTHIADTPVCLSLRELHCLLEGGDISELPPVNQLHYTRV